MRPTIEQESEKSSTQPAPEPPDPALFDRLRSVSDAEVDTAARAVNRFSEDDDAHEKRWAKAETRRTFYKIRRYFFWFLFLLACIVGTIVSLGYVALVGLWVANIIWGAEVKDPAGLQSMITNVLWTLLVIMATLFGESVFKDDER